jgi:hypothetical protein
MRLRAIPIIIFCLAAGAGCARQPARPPTVDARGTGHYTASNVAQTVACDGRPIVLEGNRTDMDLRGACWWVMLAGSHNDVTVDMAAGGRFTITGSNNDVVWRQAESGAPPVMQDGGVGNAFHRMLVY